MSEVVARIVLWGTEGAGKTTTLETIHARLRPELRGALRREATRLDPTVRYESLAISLGPSETGETRIELVAVPGAPDQRMTRKQLLDQVDGLILTLDCSPAGIERNFAAIEELREALAAYGKNLETFPVALQYNKRDLADPFVVEQLHRRIGLSRAAAFETTATSGDGVLTALTTVSKHVLRARRSPAPPFAAPTADPPPLSTPPSPAAGSPAEKSDSEAVSASRTSPGDATSDLLEAAILAEGLSEDRAEADADLQTWADAPAKAAESGAPLGDSLRIVSVGQARIETAGAIRLPVVLGDTQGETRSFVLSLRLDAVPAFEDGEQD